MFDVLVESNVQVDLKKRHKYFLASSVVVGILFSTAVVVSIYAADYSLGANQFELVEMITPVDTVPADPEPETRQAPPTASSSSSSQVATRQVNMARVDEPTVVPTTVSTVQNAHAARPIDGTRFEFGKRDTDVGSPNGSGRDLGTGGPTTGGLGNQTANNTTTPEPEETTPPPAVKPVEVKTQPKSVVSKGVLNGRARDLPKPAYSAAAKAVGAQGQVTVQVMIDEDGRVVSANAVAGHPLLRAEAEKAARDAKFSPTLLSDVPVRVTGIITYNFIR